jgi:hypothetical protein
VTLFVRWNRWKRARSLKSLEARVRWKRAFAGIAGIASSLESLVRRSLVSLERLSWLIRSFVGLGGRKDIVHCFWFYFDV